MNVEVFGYVSEVTIFGVDRNAVATELQEVEALWRKWKLAKLAKLRPFIEAVAELVVRRMERKGK